VNGGVDAGRSYRGFESTHTWLADVTLYEPIFIVPQPELGRQADTLRTKKRKERKMTLTEVIEILQDLLTTLPQRPPEDRRKAVNIAIEAVKAWKEYRGSGSLMSKLLLPGETPE